MNAHTLPVFVRPLSSVFDDFFPKRAATQGQPASRRSIPIDVWSDAEALHVEAELPGLSIDDIVLTVLGDELTLSGERTSAPVEDSTLLHQERRSGTFERRIQLPFEVQGDAVTAELLQGVLHVTLPKSEAVKPRRVPVRAVGE